jgi:hypothetical protein
VDDDRSGKSLIRMFEPLVIGAMKLYRDTHDLGLQKQVLFVMTQLIKFGVSFFAHCASVCVRWCVCGCVCARACACVLVIHDAVRPRPD